MRSMTKKYKYSLWAFLLLFSNIRIFGQGQGTQIQFGQNRVQYHDFDWQYYDSENFTTYFYPGGQNIAKFVVMAAEDRVIKMEEQFNYRINTKVEILVYNDITDLAQTNIGLGNESYNLGGKNRIIGNKIFLYFNGDHNQLNTDLNESLARIFVSSMMSGSTIQEILQNTIFGNLPPWYSEGLIQYVSQEWNTTKDGELRDYLSEAKVTKFSKLAQENPTLAGHSMWYFIEQKYGKDLLKDVIYLSRINKNAFNGFGYILGTTEPQLEIDWLAFYSERVKEDKELRQEVPIEQKLALKVRKGRDIAQLKASPDGAKLAYAVHNGGAFKLFIYDKEHKKSKKYLKGGFKSEDYPHDNSYPQIAWSPNGGTLVMSYEKKDRIKLLLLDLTTKEKKKIRMENFQRINDITFTGNAQEVVLSAQVNGKSDLYLFSLSNPRTTPITNDFWDDLQPSYINANGNEGILFVSNRRNDTIIDEGLDTILPLGTYDVFFYDLKKKEKSLSRLTNTPFASEKMPIPVSNGNIQYLSDESGIYGINEMSLLQTISYYKEVWQDVDGNIIETDNYGIDTTQLKKTTIPVLKITGMEAKGSNFWKNIVAHTAAAKSNDYYLLTKIKGKPRVIYQSNTFADKVERVGETNFRIERTNVATLSFTPQGNGDSLSLTIQDKLGLDSLFNEKTNYQFSTQYSTNLTPQGSSESSSSNNYVQAGSVASLQSLQFNPAKTVPYRAKFSSDYLVTALDNSLAFQTYENFSLSGSTFNYPDLNGMITFGITDVMEDHKIIGGIRIPSSFAGSEEFVSYQNLKSRLDYRFLFYRKSDQVQFPVDPSFPFYVLNAKLKSNYAEASASYPIDVTKSVKFALGFRNDKGIVSLTDQFSEEITDDIVENWGSARVEFVHDKSKEIQLNIRDGFRYKFFFEYFKNFNEKKSNLYNFGYDIRHYWVLHKNIIWANRLAGASSFGNKKIAYYLGGVDSWINPKFDSDIPLGTDNNYAFQAIGTNMRGFPLNARNGNSYMVINSELRVPLFSYLAKKPLKSPFLNNFQIVGFFDIGSAFKGLTPFDEENPYSTEDVNTGPGPVVVTVNYYRNPTVFGYGAGIRTTLLGYFFRVDAGWGRDGKSKSGNKPLWYFSISKDF